MARLDELKELFSLQDETLSVEFKAWLDLTENNDKATIAKSAIAMANHGGGTIVMGMGGKPPTSTPRPSHVARYTADAVNGAINRYADPHIHCHIEHLPHPTPATSCASSSFQAVIQSRSCRSVELKTGLSLTRKPTSARLAQRARSHSPQKSGEGYSIGASKTGGKACWRASGPYSTGCQPRQLRLQLTA